MRVLQAKCEKPQAFKGNPAELQQTLAPVDERGEQEIYKTFG